MDMSKIGFYLAVIFMICATVMITNCSYQEAQCKEHGITSGMSGDEIKRACSQAQ